MVSLKFDRYKILHRIFIFYTLIPTVVAGSILIYLLLFGSVGPYTSASSIYAIEVYRRGHTPPITSFSSQKYWGGTQEFENQYPIPSYLLGIFYILTGVPLNIISYIPLLISFYLIYYSFAYCFSSSKYCSMLYSLFSMFYLLSLLQISRVSLGIMFATSILYLLVKSFRSMGKRSIIISIFFAATVSFTYYTVTFMLIFLCSTLLARNLIMKLKSKHISFRILTNSSVKATFILPVFLVLVVGFISNQFLYIYAYSRRLSMQLWVQNIFSSIKTALDLEKKTYYILPTTYSYDLLTFALKKIFQIIEFLSILSIPITIVSYLAIKIKRKSLSRISSLALLSTLTIMLCIGEYLFYTGAGETIWSTRYLVLYGSVIFLGLADYLISKLNLSKKTVVYLIFSIIILAGCYGNFREKAHYFWDPTSKVYYQSFINFSIAGNTLATFYSDPITAATITYEAKIYNLSVYSIPWGEKIMNSILENNLDILDGKNIILFIPSSKTIIPYPASPIYTVKRLRAVENILAPSNIIYNADRLYALIF